jgi:peptide/nickel transport system permease protein
MIPVLLIVTMVSFSIIYLLPGDPAMLMLGENATDERLYQALRQQMGLDRPIYVQYLEWLGRILRGDLGISSRDSLPVAEGLRDRAPITIELSLFGLFFAILIALPAGIISATRPNTLLDRIGSILALGGVAIPHFWLGILLIYAFAVHLHLLPAGGYVDPGDDLRQHLLRMIMPAITLGIGSAGMLMRQIRSSLLEVLNEDYVITAVAKGLSYRRVVLRHALKNALIPVITVLGLQIGRMFGGAVITESIFSIPGMGRWAVDSIATRDFSVVQSVALVMAIGVLVANLLADISYAYVNPRIRYN